MSRLLLTLLLLACGDAGAQAIGGGAVGGGGTGAAADPTPVFDFDPGAHGSGVDNLTADTWAMTTVVECDARTDTATDWVCGTGGTFTESDGAGNMTEGRAAPFTEAAARATWFDRFGAVRAPTTSVGEVGSGVDTSVMIVASVKNTAALQYLIGKFDSVNNQGWAIRVSAAGNIEGRVNATTVGSLALDSIGQWNIIELQCDSGATNGARLYVNGQLAGSAANCPSDLTTTTAAKNLQMGCRSNGSSTECMDGSIAYARVQTCTGCITGGTSAQDQVAQRHAMQLMGIWPSQAVDPYPIAWSRTSPKYCGILRDEVDPAQPRRQTFQMRVGSYWMCVGEWQEASGDGMTLIDGRKIIGYFPEPLATNLLYNSTTYGTTWTKINAGDTVQTNPGVLSPSEEDDELDRLEADATNTVHGLQQTTASALSASLTYIFSVVAGYTDDGAVSRRYLWLRDNTVANAYGVFDLKTCQTVAYGAGLADMGTVVNQGRRGSVRIRNYGDTGVGGYRFCRAEIVVSGTAATHAMRIVGSDSSSTETSNPGAGARVLLLWHSQLESTGVAEGGSSTYKGERSSSPIPTASATAQRQLDSLRFNYTNWPSAGGTMLASYLLEDGRISGSADDYSTARTISVTPCYVEDSDDSDIVHIEQTSEAQTNKYGFTFYLRYHGTYQWSLVPTSFLDRRVQHRDGRFHWARAVVMPNDARIYLDGERNSALTQTSFTLPDIQSGGVSIGYAHVTNVEYARGLIHRCAFWAQDYAAPNP